MVISSSSQDQVPQAGPDGLSGISDNALAGGVIGSNRSSNAFGSLGGGDQIFHQHAGAYGESDQQGVFGRTTSDAGTGVFGDGPHDSFAVRGENGARSKGFLAGKDPVFAQRAGVYGESDQQGVMGLTTTPNGTGVYGGGTSTAAGQQIGVRGETFGGAGIQGTSFGGGLAGQFIGNVEVTGNLNLSSPTSDILLGDVAEGFGAPDNEIIEPGTVVVLDQNGRVRAADEAYDKKAAGVVSGAGNYRSAILLDKQSSQVDRLPVALVGKVCCKVDARYSPIEIGDLLTASPTRGHAMKACDQTRAFGSVIGKALRGLDTGQGEIPILVALQ